MKRLRNAFPGAGIFCVALLIRLVYNVTVGKHYLIEFDAHYYYDIAVGLGKYHCYCSTQNIPSVGRAPFWPYTMYIIFALTGVANSFSARVFLSMLGSGTCVLIYFFARDIFNRRVALITGAIAAIYPGLFIYDGWLYSESVYTFFLIAFAYTLYRCQRTIQPLALPTKNGSPSTPYTRLQSLARPGWPILAGISVACASLTRPNGLLLLGVVFVWALIVVWQKMLSQQAAVRAVLIITAVTVVLLAPWTARNYLVAHKFIPIAMGSGMVLTGAYNNTILQGHDMGMWVPPNEIQPPPLNADSTSTSLHWIASHRSALPFILSLHFLHTWVPYTPEPGFPFIEFPAQLSSQIVMDMIWIITPLILLLAGLGLLFTWQRKKDHLLLAYLILVMTVGQNIVFYGSSRFRAPIEPLLVLLTGGVLWWLTSKEPGTLQGKSRSIKQEPLGHRRIGAGPGHCPSD